MSRLKCSRLNLVNSNSLKPAVYFDLLAVRGKMSQSLSNEYLENECFKTKEAPRGSFAPLLP